MAISPILAQAILTQEPPDLVGSFQRGYEQARGRRVQGLAGKAIAGDRAAYDELNQLDPEIGLKIGETIRAKSAADIEDFIRDSRVLSGHLAAGDINSAKGFLDSRLARLESRGADTSQTARMRQILEERPNEAYAEVQAFLGSIDSLKNSSKGPKASATTENLAGGLRVQTLSDGTVRVVTPDNRVLTGEEATAAVRAAEERGTALQGERAGARTRQTLEERLGREPTLRERITEAESETEQRQELRKTVYSEARRAQSTLSEVKRLRTALDAVRTGRIAAARQAVGGLIPGARDADAEALNSSINEFVLRRKDELLGGGILSDADIALLQTIGPQLGNTLEANSLILDRFEQYAGSAVDRAKRLRDFKGDPIEFEIETFQESPSSTQGVQSDIVNWSDL